MGGKKSRAPLAQNDRARDSDNAGRMTSDPSAHKTVHSLPRPLSAPMSAAKSPGLLNIMACFRCIIMAMRWALIKMPVIFTAIMYGLVAASDFAVIGIRWPLIPITQPSHWRILNQCFAKSLPVRLLIRRLSIRPASQHLQKQFIFSPFNDKGLIHVKNPVNHWCQSRHRL